MTHRPSAFAQPFLARGARIALVAPSGPFDVAGFEAGVARLRTRYEVRYDPGILQRQGYFAGDDTRRTRELAAALEDPELDAIVAVRGGYGATRLLPSLTEAVRALAARPKLLVGFSDISALHALWAHARVASVHGAMVATLGGVSDAAFERWTAAVEGRGPACLRGLSTLRGGQGAGRLLGGNLAVLAALLGTPHFPDLRGAVLFLEDVGERPYRVDRMLTSLRSAGVLDAVSGIALGAFTSAEPGADGVSVHDVLHERLGDLGVPVVFGLPCGHVDDNVELPLGTRVLLDADGGELRFDDYGRSA